MSKDQNKLVGSLYLDLSQLKKDVAETNTQLKSIGTGVNLDMTQVVEKQVRGVLERFKKEIQSMAQQAQKGGEQITQGLTAASTQITRLSSATGKLNKDGSLTETRKGFDELGRSISEVYKAGQQVSRTIASEGGFSKDIKYANELYKEQLAALKKIYAQKTQRLGIADETTQAEDMDRQIADTGRQIDANNRLLGLLDQRVVRQSNLKNLSEDEAALMQRYSEAEARSQAEAAAIAEKAASGVLELRQAQEAYRQLTTAYRQYNSAVKSGNEAGKAYWSQSAQLALQEIAAVEQKLSSLNLEEKTRTRILNVIQQARDAEYAHEHGVSRLNQTLDQVGSRLVKMAATMVTLRGLSSLWREATQYAQKFYDCLNEIRIVSGKSQSEANRLGQSYRKMAQDMKVSSVEIAEAAVEFWRQGLDENTVNERLTATIQYAKISSMDFAEAAELVTSATNTMEVSARRVADVWSYLGDASASGADEIGIAMSKASASALEFGLSFEWLGAYIATISEKTRQAPQVIGTAINAMIARLHNIKEKGFNEEDATRINDVAKALATLEEPIQLIDEETGQWRDMSTIFEEIARQWDQLDGKQKAYIATVMAGTRQQNYFLALMNDMSQAVEGNSRAYELYAGAMNASGSAAQKYAVWQESVTAAQNRMKASLEALYALLDAEWMKGFYDGMADLIDLLVAGSEALDGWNLKLPLIIVSAGALVAVIYKAVAAVKAVKAAMAAGGLASALSAGTLLPIAEALAAVTALTTLISGAIAKAGEIEKVDYAGTLETAAGYRDRIQPLVEELEELANKTSLSAEEQARANEVMKTLSGTSLSMKQALEGGGEGFDTLGQRAQAARGELEKTEQVLRSLNAADALQRLRDADYAYWNAISEAQGKLISTAQYGEIASAYERYMQEHPSGRYTQAYSGPMGSYASKEENFYVYAQNQANQPMPVWYSREDKARIQADRDFWASVVAEMDALGLDYSSSVETISNKMLEFGIAAASYAEANRESLGTAWQGVFDDLYTVMTDGTQFNQLPQFMQQAAVEYYEAYIGGIDQQAELAEGQFMAMAADLTGRVESMVSFLEANADYQALIDRFEELYAGPYTQESVDELNELVPLINEFILAYNALTETTQDDIPLLPTFTLEELQAAREEIEATSEAVAGLDTTDIYKGLALAREEANGFAGVLARLGEGEGQVQNLHDAVMAAARDMAAGLGITDASEIAQIGEKLLEGLYDTYPDILQYVDTATGMLLDGWQEGLEQATDPWAELFDTMRLEDAQNQAKKDMAALDGSALWEELLRPDGKGLYAYAEDWARELIPDGTEEEIHAQAEAFVEAFFSMFAEIDTTIMDADGKIAAGMEGVVDTMRQGVHAAQAQASKLESAYKTLHADTLARTEAQAGLSKMLELAGAGDAAGVMSTFEALSTEAIDAITAAMPELIDALMDGSYAAEDFETAIIRLKEAENQAGEEAWKDYFDQTADGLKAQSAMWGEAMRGIIREVSAAEDREAAFYQALIHLSDAGLDISGMLDQYGMLAVQLLNGASSADELYAALSRMERLNTLQLDLTQADALSKAAKAIDPSEPGYDPLAALESYALLEASYEELTALQRGSAEYIARAKELTAQTTKEVYEQASVYGIITDLQARSIQAAASAQRSRRFDRIEENSYAGGVGYLESAVLQAQAAGQDVTQAWNAALAELDAAGYLEDMCALFGDISGLALECGGNVGLIIERLYEMRQAAQEISLSDMAQELRREREANQADTHGYQEQVDSLSEAFGEGGVEGVEAAMAIWNSFDETLQQSIAETYPSLVLALDEANRAAGELSEGVGELESAEGGLSDASKAAEKKVEALGKELGSARQTASARYFKNTARAIEDLKHGAIDASEAFGDYNKEAEAAVEANEQYEKASKRMASGAKVTADEVDTLAQYLGNLDPQWLLDNWDQVGPMMAAALAEGEAAFNRLNEAAFITITGTSVADFSALTAGLISVKNLAADAVEALIATGQWTLETITLPQEGAQWDPISGTWNISRMNTGQSVLRYTGSNPLRSGSSGKSSGSGSGGGGKGGGGGSSSTSVSKATEKLLDKMEAEQSLEEHRRKLAQQAQGYHETRGEIQGVILYLGKEMGIVSETNETLRSYLSTLEAQIEKKKQELFGYKEGSKQYQQAMVDLEALQTAHQEYSVALLENMTDLEEMQQAIEDWHNKVREMEIDLREMIHQAIMDREELNRRMLEGRIDLEDELLDVLTRRYERERDQLLELAEEKRKVQNEELELLGRQLEARKKLSEQQDHAKQLAEKEAQLARISADPTRKKEELALREEIAELREELAWELAEQEVEAQKKSLESQIESVDEYMEYVENYYEELLSSPRRLIEELSELLTRTDEEILNWLEQNHEEYQLATDATREEMRQGWQEMLDDMRGHTQTWWDEVEDIIAQGDEAILEFLKQNSADYKEAGALQAQAYVDEWKEQLEELRKAHKQVQDEINSYNYAATSSAKTASSSSSGSSGSSSKKTTTSTPAKQFVASGTGYAEAYRGSLTSVSYNGDTYIKDPKSSYWYKSSDAKRIDGGRTYYWKTGTTRYVKKYLEGGLAAQTGLAWVDGTSARPERILSPYQTELFESLLKTLQAIRSFQAPVSVVQPRLPEQAQQGLHIDSITVQVQRLDSEQDYEEMAERVGEHIMERVSRGMTVGGLRIG